MRYGRLGRALAATVLLGCIAAPPSVAATRALVATSPTGTTASSQTTAPATSATTTAGPPPPGDTRSHYLTSDDPALLARTGTVDAADALGQGLAQALVVLDAGSPAGADGSVRAPDTHTHETPAQVAAAAEAYGHAWLAAKGPPLVLVVGTTNFGEFAAGPHGAAWARMVEQVARSLTGIDVRGGLDAEQEYSTAIAARSWVEAYDASGTRPYVDFGSCTCAPSKTQPAAPANGWALEDVYAVAVGDGRAMVLPEIYATAGGNARDWGRVVAWSRQQHPDLPVRVLGALTELGACTGPPARSCAGIDNAPEQAWSQLTVALGVTADPGPDLRYLTDISYLPQPGRRKTSTGLGWPILAALTLLVLGLGTTAFYAWRRPHTR